MSRRTEDAGFMAIAAGLALATKGKLRLPSLAVYTRDARQAPSDRTGQRAAGVL